jgi:hypothetical protein
MGVGRVLGMDGIGTGGNGLDWNGLGWNGLGWNGLGWNGLGWNGMLMGVILWRRVASKDILGGVSCVLTVWCVAG